MTAFPKDDLIATMRCRPGALLPCKLDWPLRRVRYWGGRPADARRGDEAQWVDAWGVAWVKTVVDPGMLPFPVAHPLGEGLAALEALELPDPRDPRVFADLVSQGPSEHHLLAGEHPFALFGRAWLLAGLVNLAHAMVHHPDQVDRLFERLGAFEMAIAEQYIAMGVEAAWIDGDNPIGHAPLFSMGMWQRFVKPHLARLVDRYHAAGRLVILHSSGHVEPLIEQLAAMGVDVLDPVSPGSNDLEEVHRLTAGRMCLCGGVRASTLAGQDSRQIMVETHQSIARLGGQGGFIVGPDDEPREVGEAAREAMLNTVRYHRRQRPGPG